MSSLESNKIFAAVLVAGIAAMFSGFVADKLVHPKKLKEDAVFVDGGAVVTGGPPKIAMPEPILDLIATADIAKGEKLSKACAACHSFDKGGVSKVGPNLWGVVLDAKGAKAGFAYSDALKEVGGAWSYEDLNQFLWRPKSSVPGTKMNYIGLKKPADRAAMIAWLRTLDSSAAALPNAAEIEAEKAKLLPPEDIEAVVEGGVEAVHDAVEGVVEDAIVPHAGDVLEDDLPVSFPVDSMNR